MNNTIIIFNYHGLINGSLLDCLDLFIFCKSCNIPIEFGIITSFNFNEIIIYIQNLFLERNYQEYYNISCVREIKNIDKLDVVRYKKIIIFDYTTLLENLHFLKNSKVVFISNLLSTEINNDFFINRRSYPNLNVWGEERYSFYVEIPYIQKMLLPNISKNKNNTLLVCPGISNEDLKFLINKNNINFSNDFLLRCSSSYVKLWGNFNKLLYIQSPVLYDRKPRIIYECKKLNIPIHYYRYHDKIDGSYYRYYENVDREYTEDDKLVRWIEDE